MTRTVSGEMGTPRISTTAGPNTALQENGKRVYYQRDLFRAYESSADPSAPPKSALAIFGTTSRKSSSVSLSALGSYRNVGHAHHSTEMCLSTEQVDYLLRDARLLHAHGVDRVYGEKETLYIDDVRLEGLTMDWQRAKELYQKLLQR